MNPIATADSAPVESTARTDSRRRLLGSVAGGVAALAAASLPRSGAAAGSASWHYGSWVMEGFGLREAMEIAVLEAEAYGLRLSVDDGSVVVGSNGQVAVLLTALPDPGGAFVVIFAGSGDSAAAEQARNLIRAEIQLWYKS
jgi:hypothetical protein